MIKFKNENQFLEHTKKHIDNVVLLSNVLYNSFLNSKSLQKEFNISKKDLLEFKSTFKRIIKTHDKSKIEASPSFLEEHGLEEPNFVKLYSFAGVAIPSENRHFINSINKIDKIELEKQFQKYDVKPELQDLFKKIENIADIVERGCNPISEIEFGRKIFKASTFNAHIRSDLENVIIQKLEDYYDKMIYPQQLKFKNNLFMDQYSLEVKENNKIVIESNSSSLASFLNNKENEVKESVRKTHKKKSSSVNKF